MSRHSMSQRHFMSLRHSQIFSKQSCSAPLYELIALYESAALSDILKAIENSKILLYSSERCVFVLILKCVTWLDIRTCEIMSYLSLSWRRPRIDLVFWFVTFFFIDIRTCEIMCVRKSRPRSTRRANLDRRKSGECYMTHSIWDMTQSRVWLDILGGTVSAVPILIARKAENVTWLILIWVTWLDIRMCEIICVRKSQILLYSEVCVYMTRHSSSHVHTPLWRETLHSSSHVHTYDSYYFTLTHVQTHTSLKTDECRVSSLKRDECRRLDIRLL